MGEAGPHGQTHVPPEGRVTKELAGAVPQLERLLVLLEQHRPLKKETREATDSLGQSSALVAPVASHPQPTANPRRQDETHFKAEKTEAR